MAQQPSMGRIVHFVDRDGEAYPAIVRSIRVAAPDVVDLTAFGPETKPVFAADCVPHSDAHADYSWHWPERS